MKHTQSVRKHRSSKRLFAAGAVLALAGLGAGGCSNAGEGLFSGAGIGAISGLIIGSTVGDPGAGAAIGAAVGGGVGMVVGDQNERNANRQYSHPPRGYEEYETREYRRRAPRRTYYEYEERTEYRRSNSNCW